LRIALMTVIAAILSQRYAKIADGLTILWIAVKLLS
jgi:hypothetical protein